MLSEGVDVFKVRTPRSIVGKSIGAVRLRESIGCHIVGIVHNGTSDLISSEDQKFPENSEIILIANDEAESRFLEKYGREI